jgi:hypothetical protein
MPLDNIHSCRVILPNRIEEDSYRISNIGKGLDAVFGKLKGTEKIVAQGYRYDATIWAQQKAREHCKKNNGIKFEKAI